MVVATIIDAIKGLIILVSSTTTTIETLKGLAKELGATDEQLLDLDVRLTAAIDRRTV